MGNKHPTTEHKTCFKNNKTPTFRAEKSTFWGLRWRGALHSPLKKHLQIKIFCKIDLHNEKT